MIRRQDQAKLTSIGRPLGECRLDPNDHRKTKRSLIIVASITIAIASFEIVSDEITLLGFSLRVSQAKLIATGQLLSLLLFGVFVLRVLPVYVDSISRITEAALESKHKREALNLEIEWGLEDYPDFKGGPQGEFDALDYKQRAEKKFATERISIISIFVKSASVLLVDYTLPVLIAVFAIVAPDRPSQFFLPEPSSNASIESEEVSEEAPLE